MNREELAFPDGFLWGSATSAHQIEGNNQNNHWWVWEQEKGHIKENHVSGKACDQYNRYKSDIELLKELGHQCYRLSIEWSRVEPQEGKFDKNEIEHYRDMLNKLIDADITPMVTLHHFTNPIWLQKIGAWENSEVIDLFERYVIHVSEELGDIIPFWNTINEPMIVALIGYLIGIHPPNKQDYKAFKTVAINLLKSHAKAYKAIHETVKRNINPQVGIVKNLIAYEAFDSKSEIDVKEAKRHNQRFNWWFLDGIETGIIKPPFADNEAVDFLKETTDFIGVNYYTRSLIRNGNIDTEAGTRDRNDMGWEIYPEGLFNLLLQLKKYKKPIYITENGICTTKDERRCQFLLQHLRAVYQALQQGIDVKGYLHWSFIDNFEWAEGYTKRFGLVEIDFENFERKPRPSAYLYRDIIQNNYISQEMLDKYL